MMNLHIPICLSEAECDTLLAVIADWEAIDVPPSHSSSQIFIMQTNKVELLRVKIAQAKETFELHKAQKAERR
jgi:hypothetical protein